MREQDWQFDSGVAGNSSIMSKALERLEDIINASNRLEKRWTYDTHQYIKKKAQGLPVPKDPPKRECPKLNTMTMMAVRVAKDYMKLRVRLQQILTNDKEALDIYKKLEDQELLSDQQDALYYNTLKELLLRSVVIPPDIHMSNDQIVAFTCPACDGHTILAYGTTFYHCPKCGQRIKEYQSEGIAGATAEEINEIMGKVQKKIKADADLYQAVKDNWTIGQEYDLLLDIPEKNTCGGIKYITQRKRCKLLAKYPRYALFDYPGRSGIRFKVTQMWQDIRLVR